jgi:hypothetical protein
MQDYVNSIVDKRDNLLGQKNGNKRIAIKKLVSGYFKDKKKEVEGKGPLSNDFYNQSFLPTGKGKFDNLNKKD